MNVSTAHYAFSTVTAVARKIGREDVIYIYINKMDLIYKKGILKKLLRISIKCILFFLSRLKQMYKEINSY